MFGPVDSCLSVFQDLCEATDSSDNIRNDNFIIESELGTNHWDFSKKVGGECVGDRGVTPIGVINMS